MFRWREVPNFAMYLVSDDGEVYSLYTSQILRQRPNKKDGYLELNLYRDRKPYIRKVHQLVLEAFVGPCPDGLESRHLNGIKTDNCESNLLWGSRLENTADRIAHGTQFSPPRKFDRAAARQLVKSGLTQNEAAKTLKVSQSQISIAVNERRQIRRAA